MGAAASLLFKIGNASSHSCKSSRGITYSRAAVLGLAVVFSIIGKTGYSGFDSGHEWPNKTRRSQRRFPGSRSKSVLSADVQKLSHSVQSPYDQQSGHHTSLPRRPEPAAKQLLPEDGSSLLRRSISL